MQRAADGLRPPLHYRPETTLELRLGGSASYLAELGDDIARWAKARAGIGADPAVRVA